MSLMVFCGPPGSGKSILMKKLTTDFQANFAFSVSHTSREPRPGEVNGKDYHFSTVEEMTKMRENGDFVKYAELAGNLYGTSKKAVKDVVEKGKNCLLDIDMQGVKMLRENNVDATVIFVTPSSLAELEQKLRERNTESEESIKKRVAVVAKEMEFCSYKNGNVDTIIVNDNLEKAYSRLKAYLHPHLMYSRCK